MLSSRIEGTRASLSDVLLDEMEAGHPRTGEADVHEVRNYVTALEYGVERLATLPLSLRLVKELHARLMKGVRGDRATPGEFRRSQNWIGPAGSTPMTAAYVPPPPREMEAALADWERFLHERGKLPDLVQCALMHEQFEAIHPFLDGNGRAQVQGRNLRPWTGFASLGTLSDTSMYQGFVAMGEVANPRPPDRRGIPGTPY